MKTDRHLQGLNATPQHESPPPPRRWSSPASIAVAVAFLAGICAAAWVNGAAWPVIAWGAFAGVVLVILAAGGGR